MNRPNGIKLFCSIIFTLFLLQGGMVHAQNSNLRGHIDWRGWSFDYRVGQFDDGLALVNVTFNDLEILGRASFPVMPVYYQDNECGPYFDRLDEDLEPVPWANNARLVTREFTIGNEQWYEIGIREFIGQYDIYQVFYLSPQGIVDAHVFSRGIQCDVFHTHYPMWRFDFDIAGSENDVIQSMSASGPESYTQEFTTLATAAVSHDWIVKDSLTGDFVTIKFDTGAWNVEGAVVPEWTYENNQVGGRAYRSSEADYTDQEFNGQNLPFDNNEPLGEDIVLWYRGYMPHPTTDAAELWHSTGVRLILSRSLNLFNPGNQLSVQGESIDLDLNYVADDAPISFSATNLPTGLSIDSSTGKISGTIESTGVFNPVITISDNNAKQVSISFNWYVSTSQELACQTYTSQDVPKIIFDNNTVNSTLTVPDNLTILDINVLNMRGSHSYISDLSFSLESPSGSSVEILARNCLNENDFHLSLDDSAADAPPCPPTGGGTYKPSTQLAAFNEESSFGTWQLAITDHGEGDQGNLQEWTLEICTISTENDNNNPDLINPGAQNSDIDEAVELVLIATDPDGDALTFTGSALPSGLSIDESTGRISGSPNLAGSFAVSVSAFDGSGGIDTEAFQWVINDTNKPQVLGDTNCDNQADAVDSLFILQYTVGSRAQISDCPLSNMATDINLTSADVNGDDVINGEDATMILQCTVSIANVFCPAP